MDWWAFGILAYELMSGSNLFPENSQYDDKKRSDEVLMKITQGLRLEYPDDVTIEFRDLVKKLLELNPIKRLGNCRGKYVNCFLFIGNVITTVGLQKKRHNIRIHYRGEGEFGATYWVKSGQFTWCSVAS